MPSLFIDSDDSSLDADLQVGTNGFCEHGGLTSSSMVEPIVESAMSPDRSSVLLQVSATPPSTVPTKRERDFEYDWEAEPVRSQRHPPQKRQCTFHIQPPPIPFPKSAYIGYTPPLPQQREVDVLRNLQSPDSAGGQRRDDSICYRLDNFRAYRMNQHNRFPVEMAGFQRVNVNNTAEKFLVDGIVSADGKFESRAYVEGMVVDSVSLDHDWEDGDGEPKVWVQSMVSRAITSDSELPIWYQLGRPATEYERYHIAFLWMAAFARYFVAYLEHLLEFDVSSECSNVRLHRFRKDFAEWAKSEYGLNSYFSKWLAQYQQGRHRGKNDFRSAVAAHQAWLWHQASTTFQGYAGNKIRSATLWSEVFHLKAIKPAHPAEKSIQQTIVTPYVYNIFKELFTTKLEVVGCIDSDAGIATSNMLPTKSTEAMIQHFTEPSRNFQYTPRKHDVVAFAADEDGQWGCKSPRGPGTTDSETRPEGIKSKGIWFGYVNDFASVTREPGKTRTKFNLFITWLYAPEHTVLEVNGDYPHKHELFFSDHCNCHAQVPLYDSDIIGVVNVEFFGGPDTDADCFIRQKYEIDVENGETEEGGFVTLQSEELTRCPCQRDEPTPWCQVRAKYSPGDTVLVATTHEYLEPAILHHFSDENIEVTIRQLKRRCIDESGARANELVYTHSFLTISPDDIVRPCHIRIFPEYGRDPDFELPSPYDRHGAGDCFFITQEDVQVGEGRRIIGDVPFAKIRLGYLPGDIPHTARLKGLDLFCGGGNFGRGLEEGGAVDMKWAVDIESAPLHAYQANLAPEADTSLYLGSINNYLKDAILGRYSDIVARPGEVDFISAGSPCQGFSLANKDRGSEKSIQNCSLVSSLATAIDIYRPKYALLENVHHIAGMRRYKDRSGEYNVYATLMSAIVGMGYQCQHFILDSWSYGNAQSRTRLFLAVTAPGIGLLKRPPRSHSHPNEVRNASLYKAPGGKTFGKREMVGQTPLRYRTCGEDWGYLPKIYDAHVGVCIPFPDHRTSRVEDKFCRAILAHVPCFPSRQGWVQAVSTGRLHPAWITQDREKKKNQNPKNRAWRRIDKDGLCRTVTTELTPACQYTGTWGHYSEPRLITVQEARIAQGFPDHEVLLGKPAQQFKVVGNSVARGVSLAMGQALRRAYFEGNH